MATSSPGLCWVNRRFRNLSNPADNLFRSLTCQVRRRKPLVKLFVSIPGVPSRFTLLSTTLLTTKRRADVRNHSRSWMSGPPVSKLRS